jgi:exonuclease III
MHIPNYVSGLKGDFHAGVLGAAQHWHWRGGPAMLIGDTNMGLPGVDEETLVFGARALRLMRGVEEAEWTDAFRSLHAQRHEFTWYSPNGGNGFRLDEAFLYRSLMPRLRATRDEWGSVEGSDGEERRAR